MSIKYFLIKIKMKTFLEQYKNLFLGFMKNELEGVDSWSLNTDNQEYSGFNQLKFDEVKEEVRKMALDWWWKWENHITSNELRNLVKDNWINVVYEAIKHLKIEGLDFKLSPGAENVLSSYGIDKNAIIDATKKYTKSVVDKASSINEKQFVNLNVIKSGLAKWSKWYQVQALQEFLKSQKLLKWKIDSDFWPKTESSVEAFQEEYGLEKTWKVDKITLSKMKEVYQNEFTNPEQIIQNQSSTPKQVREKFEEVNKNKEQVYKIFNSDEFYKLLEAYIDWWERDSILSDRWSLLWWIKELSWVNDSENYFKNVNSNIDNFDSDKFNKWFENLMASSKLSDFVSKSNTKYAIRDTLILASSFVVPWINIPFLDIRFNSFKKLTETGVPMSVASWFMEWLDWGMQWEFDPKEHEWKTWKYINESVQSIKALDNELRKFSLNWYDGKEGFEDEFNSYKINTESIINAYFQNILGYDLDTIIEGSFGWFIEKWGAIWNLGLWFIFGDEKYTESKKLAKEIEDIIKRWEVDGISERVDKIAKLLREQFEEEKGEEADYVMKKLKQRYNVRSNKIRISFTQFIEQKPQLVKKFKEEYREKIFAYRQNMEYLELFNKRTSIVESVFQSDNELKEFEKILWKKDIDVANFHWIIETFTDLESLLTVYPATKGIELTIKELFDSNNQRKNDYLTRLESSLSTKDVEAWFKNVSKWNVKQLNLNLIKDREQAREQKWLEKIDVWRYKYGEPLEKSWWNVSDWVDRLSSTTPDWKTSSIWLMEKWLMEKYGVYLWGINLENVLKTTGKKVDINTLGADLVNTARQESGKHDTVTSFTELAKKKWDKEVVKANHTREFSFVDWDWKIIDVKQEVDIYVRPDCANILVVPKSKHYLANARPIQESQIDFPEDIMILKTPTLPFVFNTSWVDGGSWSWSWGVKTQPWHTEVGSTWTTWTATLWWTTSNWALGGF